MQTILVVEDEELLRKNIVEALECLFFEVLEAENGAVGVQLAQKHLPDLVLCDIMMPELDGYGVFKALRQDPETATIPFIFLSAKGEKSDIRKGMSLGADDYLTKPFTIPELHNAISTQLEKRVKIFSHFHENLNELPSKVAEPLPEELRKPLEEILSLSQVLINQYEVMESNEVREMLGKIHNDAENLSRRISNSRS